MAAFRFSRFKRALPSFCLALSGGCGGDADTVTTTAPERPQMRPGPEGCYIEAAHMCDCDLDEAACTEDVGIWVPEGCSTCRE